VTVAAAAYHRRGDDGRDDCFGRRPGGGRGRKLGGAFRFGHDFDDAAVFGRFVGDDLENGKRPAELL